MMTRVTKCKQHEECNIKWQMSDIQTVLIEIHFVSNKVFNKLIDTYFYADYTWLRRRFTRGFTSDGMIFIRRNTIIGRNILIKHEIGHIAGLNHTWKPYIMNPTWIFRWFRKW